MNNFTFNAEDEDFLLDLEEKVIVFMKTEDPELELESSNSYYRRLTHKLAEGFKLDSRSEGDGKKRYIVLVKNEKSVTPDKKIVTNQKVWDFGAREFLVKKAADGCEVYLGKDGSIGVYEEGTPFIDKKIIYTGAIRIQKNKIIEFNSPEW
ncbi:MAG: hypothetical protein ACI86H_001386 [bacterium]|jgi:hypothetical protein